MTKSLPAALSYPNLSLIWIPPTSHSWPATCAIVFHLQKPTELLGASKVINERTGNVAHVKEHLFQIITELVFYLISDVGRSSEGVGGMRIPLSLERPSQTWRGFGR